MVPWNSRDWKSILKRTKSIDVSKVFFPLSFWTQPNYSLKFKSMNETLRVFITIDSSRNCDKQKVFEALESNAYRYYLLYLVL